MDYANPREILEELTKKLIRPTPRLSISDYAVEHRKLSREDSGMHGKYHYRIAPYQQEMMDVINEKGTKKIVAMTGAQLGKSLVIMNILLYMITRRPCAMLFMLPSIKMAKKFSKLRFSPMHRDCDILKEVISPSARSGNTVTEKLFPGGALMFVGSNQADDLSSTPAGACFVDEYDRCAKEAVNAAGDKEGDPLDLLWKRLSNFHNSFMYICGTPTLKNASPTENLWEQSDKRYFQIACPSCETYQPLLKSNHRFEKIKGSDQDDPDSLHFLCSSTICERKIIQKDVLSAYRRNQFRWEKANPDADIAGFHLNQFYSPWRRWKDIGAEIVSGRGLPTKEKVVQNTIWGLPYELSTIQTPEWQKLYNLKEDFEPRIVPADACVITAFTDVQEDRFETTVFAWNRNEAWVVDHIITPGNSVWDLDDEMYEDFEKTVLEASWRHANGKAMKPRHFYIDTGHFASRLLKFCQKHRGKLIPTRGEDRLDTTFSTPKKTSINFQGRRLKTGVKRWNLGVSEIKIDLYARLNRMIAREGDDQGLRIHFNKSLPEEYFKQMVAEVCYVEHDRWGRPKYLWLKENYHANEALDTAVGNLAAFEIEGYNRWNDEHWNSELAKLKATDRQQARDLRKRRSNSMI